MVTSVGGVWVIGFKIVLGQWSIRSHACTQQLALVKIKMYQHSHTFAVPSRWPNSCHHLGDSYKLSCIVPSTLKPSLVLVVLWQLSNLNQNPAPLHTQTTYFQAPYTTYKLYRVHNLLLGQVYCFLHTS